MGASVRLHRGTADVFRARASSVSRFLAGVIGVWDLAWVCVQDRHSCSSCPPSSSATFSSIETTLSSHLYRLASLHPPLRRPDTGWETFALQRVPGAHKGGDAGVTPSGSHAKK